MGASIRPEVTANPRLARIRELVRGYAAQGANAQEIEEIIRANHPEVVATQQQELAAMPRTTGENVRGALGSALQGATFNLSDEIVGALSPFSSIAEERAQLESFRQANPATAFGLEMAGGLASGIPIARAATTGARTVAQAVPRLLASAAGGGAVAGAGAGESATGRALGAGAGAGLGALLGFGAGKVATSGVGDALGRQVRRLSDVFADQGQPALTTASPRGAPMALNAPATGAAAVAPSTFTPSVSPSLTTPVSAEFGAPALRAAGRSLQNVVAEGPKRTPFELVGPRSFLAELERTGMGEEALLMNVGDDLTVRAARAAANQPQSAAGQIVNERLARQGGALGEAVPRDIAQVTGFPEVGPATTPGAIRLDQMLRTAQENARPLYEEALSVGNIAPERAARQTALRTAADIEASGVPRRIAEESIGGVPASTEFDQFLDSPLVQAAIARVKRFPEFANLPDTDMRVLDRVYKDLGDTAAELRTANRRVEATDMENVMRTFREALGERNPAYGRATAQYAGDIRPREAFREGMEQFRTAAPGEIELALRGDDPLSAEARRLGISTAMQESARGRASNVDLGDLAQFRDVARAVVGTPQQRERFIEAFGRDRYAQAIERLLPKIRAAAQNAAARGNSTTTKQLLDALAFGDEAMLDALQTTVQRGPLQAMFEAAGKYTLDPINRAYRLGVGQTAGQTADILTTRGAPAIRSMLDLIEAQAAQDAARRAAVQPVTGAATRATVNQF